MGSKNPTTSTSTSTSSTYKANPVVQSATQNLVQSAVQQSKTTPGQLVSPTTAQQQQGYNQVGQISGIAAPYLQAATNAITGMPQFNAQTIQSYMSPYTSQVVQATMAQLQNQDRQQQQSLTGNAISAGAFGGDRAAVASGILGGQQDLANNATIANLENSGYQNAESELNTQQQTGLQTAQTALSGALGAANANIQAGTQQQQTQTAIDQANVEFPYQNLSWLSSLLGTAGSTLGGTTSGTSYGTSTQTGTSNIGSILGGITSLFSLSDERAKENIKGIGKLFDGTPVVKYNYKGDATTHVGLLAQDVEKRHPEAVAKDDAGIRYVNYDEATKGAEKRRHYDAGGTVQPFGAPFAGILPISSGGMNGQQQSEALNAQLMAAAAGQGKGSTTAQTPLNQIAGILQNKQSLQGIQNIYQMSGLQGAMGNIGDDLSLFSDGDSLIPGGLKRGGFVPRQRFADGGSPYGDLSGVNFDSAPLGSDMTNVPLPMTMPSDASPVQAAPIQSGALSVPPQSAPISGIAAINKVAPPADDTFSRMIAQESGGRQFDASGSPLTSDKGAVGIAQIMPGTAPEAAEAAGLPYDPQRLATDRAYNLALGRAYYGKMLKQFGSPELAAAAYNAGPGAVQHALAMADKNGGSYSDYLPHETQNYVSSVFGDNAMPKDALAFDGNGAPVSGLGVPPQSSSQAAPQQSGGLGGLLGGIVNGISGLFNSNAPHDAQHQMGGFNPFGLDDTTRHALLATGLGMMASKAHWAGQQIGEGGLAGLNYLIQDKNQTRQNALAQSNIAYQQGTLAIDARKQDLAERRAEMMIQSAANAARAYAGGTQTDLPKGLGAATGNAPASASGSAPVAPSGNAPVAGAGPMQPGGSGTAQSSPQAAPVLSPSAAAAFDWTKVSPESNPSFLDARASRAEAAAAASFMNPQIQRNYLMMAQRDRQTAQQIRQSGRVTLRDGSTVVMPGAAESAATMAGATSAAQAEGRAPFQFQKVAPGPGQPEVYVSNADLASGRYPGGPNDPNKAPGTGGNGEAIASQPKAFEKSQEQLVQNDKELENQYIARQSSLQRLNTIAHIMRTYTPGAFAEEKSDIARSLESVGIPVSQKQLQNASNFQEFLKDATAQVFDQVKQMGGRILVSEISGLTKSNVNPELEPSAAQHILAQTIGVSNWLNKYTDAYYDWRKANPYASEFTAGHSGGLSKQDFDKSWVKANPVQQFVDSARHELPYQGQPIPSDPKKREVGQLYENSRGQVARWTQNGFQPVAQ